MSNQALISLAKEYIIIGSVLVGIVVLAFLFVHIVIGKKQMKYDWKSYLMKGVYASFVIYLIVVIGATLIRNSYDFSSIFYLRAFYSYKMAWNSASYTEWRNLILNILMFVPLGIYLPMLFVKFRKFYIVYGLGFMCSLGIEITQVVLKRGIGELDDLFNNTLGTIIGYGIFVFFYTLISRRGQEHQVRWSKVICLQIPFVLTITMFGALFFIYNGQDFGNLLCEKAYTIKMKDVSVSTSLELSEVNETAPVYALPFYTADELMVMGNELLSEYDVAIDEDDISEYESVVVFRAEDGSYHLWMDYKGGGYELTNFTIMEETPDTSLSEEEVREYLSEVGVDIPEEAVYTAPDAEQGSNESVFYVESVVQEDIMTTGTLNCIINTDGIVMRMGNYIYDYTYISECELYSEKEIYEMIVAGEFTYYGVYELENLDLTIKSMEISYELDSKSFYQPVYIVEVVNGEEIMQLTLPAMK